MVKALISQDFLRIEVVYQWISRGSCRLQKSGVLLLLQTQELLCYLPCYPLRCVPDVTTLPAYARLHVPQMQLGSSSRLEPAQPVGNR